MKSSMQRYIAFLRAINVGGHTVKMDRLRALFGEMDFGGVETFIASGNVIFDAASEDSAALEGRIERHLKQALGYEVATFLRTPAELAAVAAHDPFGEADVHALYVGFLKEPPSPEARAKVAALQTETDVFHIHRRELYWLCRTRISDSPVSGARLEKALGMPATLRNVTTVRKVAQKYSPAE